MEHQSQGASTPLPLPLQFIALDDRVKVGENQLTYGSELSAGLDLSVWPDDEVVLEPGQSALITSGFKLWINDGYTAGFIYPRSGLGSRGLVLGNNVGVVDADYQGEWKVCLYNRTRDETFTVKPGDRVAQVVFQPVGPACSLLNQINPVNSFYRATERGEDGYGSTGVGTDS